MIRCRNCQLWAGSILLFQRSVNVFVFKRTFNYRYMFYYMNRNIVLTSLCTLYGLCSQCSLVCWRWIICSSKLQGRYNSVYNQLSATDKHVLESVHVTLSSYWKEEDVYALVFSCFLKTQMSNLLVFAVKICQHIHLLALEIFQYFL